MSVSSSITRKAPTTAAMKLFSGDASVTGVELVNNGSVIVYIGKSSSLTASAGSTPLYPKCFKKYAGNPGDLYGITASSTGDVAVEQVVGGTTYAGRLDTSGAQNSAASTEVPSSDGQNLVTGNVKILNVSTAITPNSTTTTEAAGTIAVTSNATGKGQIFVSDGSRWQLMTAYADREIQTTRQTIATSGGTSFYAIAPCAGIIESIDFVGIDALTQHASNYLTFTALNLGQSGSGSTAVLAVSDANTTKTSTGSAIAAKARRQMTLHGTAANLVVAKGDVIEITATASGTPANTVSGNFQVRVTRTA